MKHYVSVYCSTRGSLIQNLCRVFDTKAKADAYKLELQQRYTMITIL